MADRVVKPVVGHIGRGVAIDDLLHRLVLSVADMLEADRGTIYLLDPNTKQLVSRGAHLPELSEIRLAPGQGVAGHVAATGEILNVPTSDSEGRFFSGIDEKTGYRTESILAAPIRDQQARVIGVMQLLNKRSGAFSKEDAGLIQNLAKQAGITLEATTLYRELAPSEEKEGEVALTGHLQGIIGTSDTMRNVARLTERVARSDATVLIRGESGTGKELFARALHINSDRRDAAFVKVDCAALPEGLIENELFGHEEGAFTDALRSSQGKFERAHGGTIFLDEIGELSPVAQSKLLRVLQDREFDRVGGTELIKVNVRVVTATHRDLERMVKEGSFRQDLYFRLRVVEMTLPPLRERGATDIAALTNYFLERARNRYRRPKIELSPAARTALEQHHWPGNVRELEHRIESAVVVSETEEIQAAQLALQPLVEDRDESEGFLSLKEAERRHMQAALRTAGGNKTKAAALLGIGRNTLARKLDENTE